MNLFLSLFLPYNSHTYFSDNESFIDTEHQVTVLKQNTTANENHHTATTTITTVATSNVNSSNNNNTTTVSALNQKSELHGTTTIQITSNQQMNNSNSQQVCLESMQLNDVDVRTNAHLTIHISAFFMWIFQFSFMSSTFFLFCEEIYSLILRSKF
jgi:uncharacterized protein (UPF0333 family)